MQCCVGTQHHAVYAEADIMWPWTLGFYWAEEVTYIIIFSLSLEFEVQTHSKSYFLSQGSIQIA